MNKDMFKQVVDTIKDMVAEDETVNRESQAFALRELNRDTVPDEVTEPLLHQFYYELVATFITKALIQAAQDQRLIK